MCCSEGLHQAASLIPSKNKSYTCARIPKHPKYHHHLAFNDKHYGRWLDRCSWYRDKTNQSI